MGKFVRWIHCLVCVVLSGFLAVSVATYDVLDVSFNTSGTLDSVTEAKNLAGKFGAYIGDAIVQGFGISAIIPMIFMLLWVFRVAPRAEMVSMRVLCVLGCTSCVGGIISKLSFHITSRFYHGGFVGSKLVEIPYGVLLLALVCCGFGSIGLKATAALWSALLNLLVKFRFRDTYVRKVKIVDCGKYVDCKTPATFFSSILRFVVGVFPLKKSARRENNFLVEDDAPSEPPMMQYSLRDYLPEEISSGDTYDDGESSYGGTDFGSESNRDEDLEQYDDFEDFNDDDADSYDENEWAASTLAQDRSVPSEEEIDDYDDEPTLSQEFYTAKQHVGGGTTVDAGYVNKLKSIESFALPSVNLLSKGRGPVERSRGLLADKDETEKLYAVLKDFGVNGRIINVFHGPVVTTYEFEPCAGTKASRIIGLSDDIARSMCALSTRISIVPGRNVLGIELPNYHREVVMLRDIVESEEYRNPELILPVVLGKGVDGRPVVADLTRMPHLLIAGTTGSGKSVGINTMVLSLLYRLTPEQCRMIMIDPKVLELSVYDNIPHLLTPVVTEAKKAVAVLKWVVAEMEERYRLMSAIGVRNITGYNEKISEAMLKGEVFERTIQRGFDRNTGDSIFERESIELVQLPYIVVVVDEMADLMIVSGKEIESSVQRLSQMARAAGIHIIMATQRPSVDVITGVIKANFPTRVSFAVTSKVDSRTILGEQGAEQLLGMGDMLYMVSGGKIKRVHGAFVSDGEVRDVVSYLTKQREPDYVEAITAAVEGSNGYIGMRDTDFGGCGDDDSLYEKAVAIVCRGKKVSVSYIQRQLRIGYNRASNLVERMEREGIVTAMDHLGRREVVESVRVDQ